MKYTNHIYLFVVLCATVLFASCSREEADLDLPNPANIPSSDDPGAENLGKFNLIGPETDANLAVDDISNTLSITWEASASTGTVTYEWLLDAPDGDFSAPIATISSDNAGSDNKLTIAQADVFNLLTDNGIDRGGSFSGKWTVRATEGTNTRLANTPFLISLEKKELPPPSNVYTIRLVNFPDLNGEDVYVAGEFQKAGVSSATGNWQTPGDNIDLKLQQDTDGSYFIELPNVPEDVTSFAFKFFRGTGWDDGEQIYDINGDCAALPSDRVFMVNPDNRILTFNVERWQEDACPTDLSVFKVTVEAGEIPADKGIFLAGEFGADFGGVWQEPGTISTLQLRQENATTYYLAVSLPAGAMAYKYSVASTDAPTWDNGAADMSCNGLSDFSVTIVPGTTITNDNVVRFEGVGSCAP